MDKRRIVQYLQEVSFSYRSDNQRPAGTTSRRSRAHEWQRPDWYKFNHMLSLGILEERNIDES